MSQQDVLYRKIVDEDIVGVSVPEPKNVSDHGVDGDRPSVGRHCLVIAASAGELLKEEVLHRRTEPGADLLEHLKFYPE